MTGDNHVGSAITGAEAQIDWLLTAGMNHGFSKDTLGGAVEGVGRTTLVAGGAGSGKTLFGIGTAFPGI